VPADGVVGAFAVLGLPTGCLPRIGFGPQASFIIASDTIDLGPGESGAAIDEDLEITCDAKLVASGDYTLTWAGLAGTTDHGGVFAQDRDADPLDNVGGGVVTLQVRNNVDDDRDGCANGRELGLIPVLGGQRDSNYFWDFMDVPAGMPPQRDRRVSIGDIGAVVARFGSFRQPPPTKEEALVEALTPPPPAPAYHAAYDRGGSIDNLWNQLPPDGRIIVADIGAVVAQFGHTCA